MKLSRLLLFVAATLVLFITACSQPEDSRIASLAPQFGTAGDDGATSVAASSAHPYVFVAGVSQGSDDRFFLRRYNRDGSLAWEWRSVAQNYPHEYDYYGFDHCHAGTHLGTDSAGNAYLAYSSMPCDENDEPSPARPAVTVLRKFNKNGTLLWRKGLNLPPTCNNTACAVDATATDGAGNTYLAINSFVYDTGSTVPQESTLQKYDTTGTLKWERVLTAEQYPGLYIDDLALAADGSLYTLSEGRWLTKYTSGGTRVRQVDLRGRTDRSDDNFYGRRITTSGSAVYLAGFSDFPYPPTLVKYNSAGVRQWLRTDTGYEGYTIAGLNADAAGNLYLTTAYGYYRATQNVHDLFVRKYTATGSPGWTYRLARPGTNEDAYGVVARSSGEVYAVGTTNGKVNDRNSGGYDAFVLRLDEQGRRVWWR